MFTKEDQSFAYVLSHSGLTDSGKIAIALAKEGVKKGSGCDVFVVENIPYNTGEINYRGTYISSEKIEEKGRLDIEVHGSNFLDSDTSNLLSNVVTKKYGRGWIRMQKSENTGTLEEIQKILKKSGLSALYGLCVISRDSA